MYRFLLRVFLLFGFVVLSLSVAQAQTLYGIEFNKPLKFPECETKQIHYPKEVCYVDLGKEKSGSVWVQRRTVYFPKGKEPVGASSNYLRVDLWDNRVVEMLFMTDGASVQERFFQILQKKFGEPLEVERGKGDDDSLLAKGATRADWFTEGLWVTYYSNLRGAAGVGILLVSTDAFAKAKELEGRNAEGFLGLEYIKLGKPLDLPQCRIKQPHVPEQMCYVNIEMTDDTVWGTMETLAVYFPKNMLSVTSTFGVLVIGLIDNKVVAFYALTNGLSEQETIFEMMKADLGEPDGYRVVTESEPELHLGAIVARWVREGIVVTFMGSLRANNKGMLYVTTEAFNEVMEFQALPGF